MKSRFLNFLASVVILGAATVEAQNPSEGMLAPQISPVPSPTSAKKSSTPQPSPEFPTSLPLKPGHASPQPYKPIKHDKHIDLKGQPYTPEISDKTSPTMVDQAGVIEQVIRDQLRALNEGDVSKAYYAFGSEDFKKKIPLETFKQFVKANRILIVNRHMEIEKPVFKGVAAQVRVKLGSGAGDVRVEYELILEEGVWKVYRLEVFKNGI